MPWKFTGESNREKHWSECSIIRILGFDTRIDCGVDVRFRTLQEFTIDEEEESEVDDGGSGFSNRKNGKGPKFTSTKFWNFVDCSLQAIRQAAQREAGPNHNTSARGAYENAVRNILVEYFQMDLAEFPGSMVVPKLLATTSPQWQTTIQNSLLWN
ncbi:hypothetical protein F4604DRAFT_1929431 [Suillus subluteus]|nr:hypothetical protein F4604DRAFT_1929431 [Suillus subluteus]